MMRAMAGAAAAAALLGAPVQAGCWKADEAAAATVRELQSMLMVAALRCQASGHGIMADYNAFVLANKSAITAQNEKLKAHFIHAAGPVAGQRAYDSFTTSMANGYGAGASGAEACADADTLAREAAMMTGSLEGLQLLAERQGLTARLPEGPCGAEPALVIAAAAPAVVPAALVTAATPLEEPIAGDETSPATPVGRIDPAAAIVPVAAAASVAAIAPAPVAVQAPVVMVAAAPAAPAYPAPQYQPAPAYYPAPAYAAAYPPGYQPYPAPSYAPQVAYGPAPRWAPAPAYAYAPAPGWGPQR